MSTVSQGQGRVIVIVPLIRYGSITSTKAILDKQTNLCKGIITVICDV